MASFAKALLCLAAALAPARAGKALVALRHGGEAAGNLVRPIEFKHKLRVCNAFPCTTSIDVFKGQEKLTQAGPMAYKECRDFDSQLLEGDRLEFKVGDSTAGTFAVGELPANDAVLLLAIHRHDQLSTAVSFESHTFAAGIESPQIAVIDTYRGSAQSVARIADVVPADDKHDRAREEELRFDNAVAVSPGSYEVFLAGSDGERKAPPWDTASGGNTWREANSSFVALKRESYVILRIGVEAKGQNQKSYPQEIMVYPQSSAEALQSGARSSSPLLLLILTAVASIFRCGFVEP